jgi:hypothetical protein
MFKKSDKEKQLGVYKTSKSAWIIFGVLTIATIVVVIIMSRKKNIDVNSPISPISPIPPIN